MCQQRARHNLGLGDDCPRSVSLTPRWWLLVALFVLMPGGFAGAQLPVPPGLQPGDQYHLLFNSSRITNAVSADVANYNAVAQVSADLAGLGVTNEVTWKAVVSTPTVDARDNAPVGIDIPVFSMNLDLIASGFDDFWDGALLAGPAWDEFGRPNGFDAWTGSQIDGTGAPGLEVGSTLAAWCGRPTLTDARWLNFLQPSVETFLGVYALSEPLTVPFDGLVGDYNLNGVVDTPDYNIWRDSFRAQVAPFEGADGNGNGVIDTPDYNVWRDRFGNRQGNAVPEPTAIVLLLAWTLSWLASEPARLVERRM